jgi:hypothetical protein
LRKTVAHIAQLEAIINSRLPGRQGSVAVDERCVTFKDATYGKQSHRAEEGNDITKPKDWSVKMEREGTVE